MKEKRQQEILAALEQYHFLNTRQCAALFNRSEATLRRDFILLQQAGLVKRLHGGIRALTDDHSSPLAPVNLRGSWNQDQKRLLAETAVKYIGQGESIMIHGGTTTARLAPYLDRSHRIITNSPSLCSALTLRFPSDGPEVILAGGQYDFRSGLIRGTKCCTFMNEYQCDLAIASPFGCDSAGILEADDEFAELLRVILRNSRRKILLMDSSKFHRHGIRRVMSWDKIDLLITTFDRDNHDILREIRRHGTEVVIVPSPNGKKRFSSQTLKKTTF